ncbi:hypothetical protein U14_00111 [Candidatus Moduliflexus flocculans]|uniref:Uncharacterized protein n=1 Tax=Candidatus Moduliflexus flocculans TaxID=1499966 RepID=A0A0S6VSN3_9BACT|nr:hypothetical protein U14_00111 [Candidatus Moduliflexus flocculans]
MSSNLRFLKISSLFSSHHEIHENRGKILIHRIHVLIFFVYFVCFVVKSYKIS